MVLADPSRETMFHQSTWHMFLPSDVTHGSNRYVVEQSNVCVRVCLCMCVCGGWVGWFSRSGAIRFASIFHYDERLFRQRFLGDDPAVTC